MATESLHKFAQEAVAKHTKTLSATFGDDVESVECSYLGVSNGGADGEFDAGALAAAGSLLCYRWKLRLKDGNASTARAAPRPSGIARKCPAALSSAARSVAAIASCQDRTLPFKRSCPSDEAPPAMPPARPGRPRSAARTPAAALGEG